LFVALYAIISALFTSTTACLPNYSSGNIKTNSIQPVSACLAIFEAIWHFLQVVWHFCSLGPGNPACLVIRVALRHSADGRVQSVRSTCTTIWVVVWSWVLY